MIGLHIQGHIISRIIENEQQADAFGHILFGPPAKSRPAELLPYAWMIRQIQKAAINGQQPVILVTQEGHVLIKVLHYHIVQLQKGFRRQEPPCLAEGALGHPPDTKIRVLRLFEKAVHLPLEPTLSHLKYADYQIIEWQSPVPCESPFPAVLVTAFKILIIIDMVVELFR